MKTMEDDKGVEAEAWGAKNLGKLFNTHTELSQTTLHCRECPNECIEYPVPSLRTFV